MRGNLFRHLISKYLLNASQVQGIVLKGLFAAINRNWLWFTEGEKEFTGRKSGSKQNWQENQWTRLGNNLGLSGQSLSQAHTTKTAWLGASGLDTKCWHCHRQPLPGTPLMPQLLPSGRIQNCPSLLCNTGSRFKVPDGSPRAAEPRSHIQAPAAGGQGKWVSGNFSFPGGSQGLPPDTPMPPNVYVFPPPPPISVSSQHLYWAPDSCVCMPVWCFHSNA